MASGMQHALARRFIEPHASIVDPGERRQARLLSALLLVFTPLVAATILLAPRIANPGNSLWRDPMFLVGSAVLVVYVIAYALSRRSNWRMAAYTFIAVALMATWALILTSAGTVWEEGAPAFLLFVVLFSSLFLDVRYTAFVAVLNVVSLTLYGRQPGVDTGTFVIHIIVQVIMPPIILAAAILRRQDLQQIEGQRLVLEQAEAQFRGVVESTPDALVMVDREGTIVLVNSQAEKSFGYSRNELLGKPVEILIPARYANTHPNQRDAYMASPIRRPMGMGLDLHARRKDGTEFPVEISLSPIQAQRGSLVLSLVRDITARKQAEAELEASKHQMAVSEKLAALGTMVSGVGHEVRTPLTYINTNLALVKLQMEKLIAGQATPEATSVEVARLIDKNKEGVQRIDRIIQQLRQFAKAQLKTETSDLREVVANAVDLFRSVRHGQVLVDADLEDVGKFDVDKGQIQQVLINLLNNGAEAMGNTGRLKVRLHSVAGGVEIEVEDHGSGIPKGAQGRIFDPFFTTKAEGTGLGLSISRRIIESHGGAIRFKTGPDGTTFTLVLPSKTPEAK